MSESIQSRLIFRTRSLICPADGGLEPELVEKICSKFPEGKIRNGWQGHGSTCNDPYLIRVLEYANSIGINIPPDCSAVKSGVDYRIFPEAAKASRIKSKYKEPGLFGAISAEISFTSDGLPFAVNDARLKKGKNFDIGSAFACPNVLVRAEMKRKFEDAGLKGLVFVRLKIGDNRLIKDSKLLGDDWPVGIEPLYLLTSDVELPFCKNWMYDNEGRVFHPEEANGELGVFYPLNGRENMGALHYSESEITCCIDSDVVRTCERFYGYPKILVSDRFQKICKELGIKGMKYDLGYYVVVDETPWALGTDGARHLRYSGPPPNPPVD